MWQTAFLATNSDQLYSNVIALTSCQVKAGILFEVIIVNAKATFPMIKMRF